MGHSGENRVLAATDPFLKILLFRLRVLGQRSLIVEVLVRFLTQVIDSIHQQTQVFLKE